MQGNDGANFQQHTDERAAAEKQMSAILDAQSLQTIDPGTKVTILKTSGDDMLARFGSRQFWIDTVD